MKPVRVISTCIAIATLGVVAPSICLAQARASTTGELMGSARKTPEYLASIPDDVDAVLAFRSLAELRSSPMGAFCVKLLDAEAMSRVREGWSDLARAMGLSPSDAFDAVMGGRVVLALRRTDYALPDWSIQASVDAKTEELLRKRLKVAPRTIVGGQTIYAVERGALELTVARSADSRRSARIVLAPAESRLFEDIVRGRANGQSSVTSTPMGRMIFDAPASDVFAMARLRERDDAWAAMVGRIDDHRFVADVRGSLSRRDDQRADVPGWSVKEVRRLAEGTLAAMFDTGASAMSEIGDVLGETLPEELRTMLRQNDALTGREALLILEDPSGPPVILCAVELRDFERGAVVADQAMDAMLELAGLAPRRFGGIAPLALRRVEDGAVSLGWLFAPVDAQRGEARAWWMYGTNTDRLDVARQAFVNVRTDKDDLRAAALLEPARLIESLVHLRIPTPVGLDAFQRVRSVEWVESKTDPGRLEASLVVEFAVDGATPQAGETARISR